MTSQITEIDQLLKSARRLIESLSPYHLEMLKRFQKLTPGRSPAADFDIFLDYYVDYIFRVISGNPETIRKEVRQIVDLHIVDQITMQGAVLVRDIDTSENKDERKWNLSPLVKRYNRLSDSTIEFLENVERAIRVTFQSGDISDFFTLFEDLKEEPHGTIIATAMNEFYGELKLEDELYFYLGKDVGNIAYQYHRRKHIK